ncbi:MAG: response regulator [Anaerolineae bacterium]|nr:response regulator [Anaerolineae bacterium]MBN8619491.1 response regulator [Anaerolineae bacterium]
MSQKNWHILVVEDDPDGQEVVATILGHLNLSFDVANNVAEAEELLFRSGTTYHVAILDLALPDKNGWDLLAEILEDPKTASLPCIAVTAYHTSKLREDAIRAGFTAYFAKPIDATAFARRLEELV